MIALAIVLVWVFLIVLAFGLCRTASRPDQRLEDFHRGPSGWRH